MDELVKQITDHKIPVGRWGDEIFQYITDHFEKYLTALSDGIAFVLDGAADLLAAVPPLLLILIIALFAGFVQKSWKLAIGVALGLLFILNQDLWKATLETIVLVVAAASVSMIVGVPLGILAAHNKQFYKFLLPILDLMQTMPTFVYLIPVLVMFGLGVAPSLFVTIIFALPAPVRLTYLGINGVPKALIEAGQAFGATKSQLLRKIELPYAMPTIMAGLTQCIMLSLSMVVIAALIGAAGLGSPVVRALNTKDIAMGVEAGLAIVILAIILDRICRVPTSGAKS